MSGVWPCLELGYLIALAGYGQSVLIGKALDWLARRAAVGGGTPK